MKIEKFYSLNFRNLKEIDICFDSKMNVFCGENAQGKTNILENLWLFTGAKSFRSAPDSSFVEFNENKAVSKIEFTKEKVKNTAKLEFTEKRTAFLNEKALSSPSLLAGNLRAIIFTPADLSLIKDGPDKRRKFLDLSIGQMYPFYIETLREYLRAVKQRNEIIKNLKYDKTSEIMLDVFEENIFKTGTEIISYREKYIELIKNYLPQIYGGMAGKKENIEITYKKSTEKENLREKLILSRKEDMLSGVTSVGPHRDDLEFLINKNNARAYGSQGQMRSVALSLKLTGAEIIKEKCGEYPICLLDDVMSELDESRQNYVLNHIDSWQSFITCCETNTAAKLKNGKIFKVQNGEII